MKVKMTGLYHLNDTRPAWYRKLGDCFDFVNTEDAASELTKEEVDKVMEHKDWYMKMYGASEMAVVE